MRRQSVFVRSCIIWPEESLGKGGSRFCQLPGGSIRSANAMIPKNISGSSWRETFFSFNGFSYKPESLTFPRIGPAFFLDWGALLRWKLNEKKISMCAVVRFLENCSQTVSKHKSLCFHAFNLKKKKIGLRMNLNSESQMMWFTAPACGRKSFPVFLGMELTTEGEEAMKKPCE